MRTSNLAIVWGYIDFKIMYPTISEVNLFLISVYFFLKALLVDISGTSS
jgi:hypothetical protein